MYFWRPIHNGALAQLARARHWQCRGHRFESGRLHFFLRLRNCCSFRIAGQAINTFFKFTYVSRYRNFNGTSTFSFVRTTPTIQVQQETSKEECPNIHVENQNTPLSDCLSNWFGIAPFPQKIRHSLLRNI